MSNELEIISQEDLAALAHEMGASAEELQGGGSFLPAVKVWLEDDAEADDAPRLKGKLYVTQQETTVFAQPGTVVFRPLTHVYQWTHFDPAAKKTINRTRMIFSFKEEARDERGTLRCGKPTAKVLRDNPDLAKRYEDVTTYRRVQGLISYRGIDDKGNQHEVKDLLVSISFKGSNFNSFQDDFIKSMPSGSNIWDWKTGVSLSREKNGSVTYYVFHFDPDFTNRVPMDRKVYDTIVGLNETIKSFNDDIDKKYYSALHDSTQYDAADAALAGAGSSLPEDIPF